MKEQAAKVEYQKRKVGKKTLNIAVVDLPSFYGGSDDNARDCFVDLKRIVEEANAKKVDGMIIDLSTNGGGLLQDAVRIAGLFIRTGSVVATQDGKKNREVLTDEDPRILFAKPLIILTSRQSASASEIFAGAMKDYKRALIVGGDHTYGKGSVQVLTRLPLSLGAMKLTTQMFYLPGGVSTQHGGVSADVALPSYLDLDDLGEQFMDYALPPSTTTPFISMDSAKCPAPCKTPSEDWKQVDDSLVKQLKAKSSVRVTAHAEFKEILKELEDLKKNEGWVKVSDILNRSTKDKDKRKEKKDKASTAAGRKELWLKTPHVQEAINIMQDWLLMSQGQENTPTASKR
jgi:carboxyl-terminal processing protease